MNIFKCRLCGSSNLKSHLKLKNFPKAAQHFLDSIDDIDQDTPIQLDVSECLSCGLVQLENDPVDYYKDVITAASLNDKSKEKLSEEWMPIIKKYNLTSTNAVEIGSCRGDFLEVLTSLGFDVTGIENSLESCEISTKRGNKTISGYLDEVVKKTKQTFSLVVCNNFLEHQPRTSTFIKGFKSSIKRKWHSLYFCSKSQVFDEKIMLIRVCC